MRIGRSLAIAFFAALVLPCWGCGLAPHAFRKFQPSAPLARARAVSSAQSVPDSRVVPALVARLEDEDPVVRLAATEELKKRTGRDFGFVPWASPEDRARAVAQWRSWLTAPPMPAGSPQTVGPPPLPPPPAAKKQRRRRAQAQPAPLPQTPAPTLLPREPATS